MKEYEITIKVRIDDNWRTDAEETVGLDNLSKYIRREVQRRVAMHPGERVELVGWKIVKSPVRKIIERVTP